MGNEFVGELYKNKIKFKQRTLIAIFIETFSLVVFIFAFINAFVIRENMGDVPWKDVSDFLLFVIATFLSLVVSVFVFLICINLIIRITKNPRDNSLANRNLFKPVLIANSVVIFLALIIFVIDLFILISLYVFNYIPFY